MAKKDMKIRKNLLIVGLAMVLIMCLSSFSISAEVFGGGDVPSTFMGGQYNVYGSSVNPQFNQPGFSLGGGINPRDYWGNFNKEDCKERQDVILTIPPGGCSPSVVRSDLLEEQNVPVFCKVSSIQVNPLIDISRIRSIRFKGDYPSGVSGVSYYPARTAVRRTNQLIGSPIVDNVGYLVILLKRTASEEVMPDWLEGEITAVIDYDSEGAFGVGRQDFYLNEMSDEQWEREYKDYGFWKGKGFIRLDFVDENSARISIYRDATNRETSVNIVEGQTSGDIYLGGSYCAAGMNIKLEEVGSPVDTALLKVDDEEIWVSEGGRFLDDKCRVKSFEPSEVGGGLIRLNCAGAGSFELMLNDGSANLQVDGEESEYNVGEKVKTSTDGKNIYLAYVGNSPEENRNFIVLIKTNDDEETFLGRKTGNYLGRLTYNYGDDPEALKTLKQFFSAKGILNKIARPFVNLFSSKEEEFYIYIITSIMKRHDLKEEDIKILVLNVEKLKEWDKQGIEILEPSSGKEFLENNTLLKGYYDKAIESYDDVFELYPLESKDNSKSFEPYGVQALYNAAELSAQLGLQAEQIKYLEKLIENYPNTNLSNYAESELIRAYKGRVSKNSQAIVYVNNEPHFISLKDIKKSSYEDLGAELIFTVDGKQGDNMKLEKNQQEIIGDELPVEIIEIEEDYIKIRYLPKAGIGTKIKRSAIDYFIGKDVKTKTQTLEIGKSVQLTSNPSVDVRLIKTNLEKQAKIKINPKAFGTRTESNFNFKIGIEKRAVKLSPEKTQEMVDNLDEQIKEWEEINNKLEKVVKGMKGACFATSAMLTVKNFISGLSGASMARNEVMTASGGWNQKCEIAFANKDQVCGKGIPSSISDCLLKCNKYINNDVEELTKRYEEVNSDMEDIQKQLGPKSTDPLDFAGSVNPDEVKVEYCKVLKQKYTYNANMKIPIKGEGEIPLSDIVSEQEFNDCNMSLQNMKDLITYSKLSFSDDSVLYDVGMSSLGQGFGTTYMINQITRNEGVLKDKFGNVAIFNEDKSVKYQVMSEISELKESGKYIFSDGVSKVFTHVIEGKEVVIGLADKGNGKYVVKDVFGDRGEKLGIYKKENDRDVLYKEYFSYYKQIDEFTLANPGMYQNPIKIIKGEPMIKYYTRAPYEGLPAQVPFNQKEGWYVTTDYILSGFGKPYEDSGRAVNFWICNVGENGLIEGKERDDCRYYNLGSSADLDFPGLSKSKSATLVRDAENALREASRRYGDKEVRINDGVYKTGITEGGESGRCSDFMSPQDCHLMFNVCDPVICPESRCDFGGAYRVSNVVQSGIIGSLLLCLPNAQEGIAIPICLSGVHAGLDSYISILTSTQDCLQESLDTGRNIGICDEVKSVYLCEFFWKQAVPLMDVFIPRLFEMSLGQGTRGGGEYATVDHAWQNMQGSIDYFKNQYAVNAVKAFNQRSTEGVGGEVCKMFVSARYPSSKEFFDNLVEPDSPVQFTGWFSENILNEATIPPTSHYKVYYHIYAGKDIGANYVVYLKNPPQSTYVNTMFSYVVDRGFIPKGGQVDEARDFTSVTGYQELCININGQEECGFKQVSTSWAIDELSNRYVKEQASQTDIDSSDECVAGSPSLWSFAQPNLQAGAQEALNPELYKRGVIRVCSKGNPGAQVEADVSVASSGDRWQRVGYCDESSGIGCWIDADSVKNVLRNAPNLTDEVLDEISVSDVVEGLEDITPNQVEGAITNAKDFVNKELKDVEDIDKEINPIIIGLLAITERGGPFNYQKANAFLLMGEVYHKITSKIFGKDVIKGGGLVDEDDEGDEDEEEGIKERTIDFNELKKSIAKIVVPSEKEPEIVGSNYIKYFGSGTGFFINSKEGLILSAFHNVKDAGQFEVIPYDSLEYKTKYVLVKKDQSVTKDVVLLKTALTRVPSFEFGDSDKIDETEEINILGLSSNNYYIEQKSGKITKKEEVGDYGELLFTDIKITEGFSGSPLLNLNGEVIGIVILARKDSMEAVVLPINTVKEVLNI